MSNHRFQFIAILLATLLGGFLSAHAQPAKDKHVAAELISSVDRIAPGTTFDVGLRLIHDDKWHTYWRNPGDSGLPTTIAWDLPEGITASDIHWPAPEQLITMGLVSYGYSHTVVLPVTLTVAQDFAADGPVKLAASVEWLMCADVCIPGGVDIALDLPVGESPQTTPGANAITAARATVPKPLPGGWTAEAHKLDQELWLTLTAPEGALDADPDTYFYDNGTVVAPGAQQTVSGGGTQIRLKLAISDYAEQTERLAGALVTPETWVAGKTLPSLAVDIPIADGPPASLAVGMVNADAAETSGSGFVILILVGAFVGGFILNLMPCVFPIIGIKILSFVNQAGEDRAKVIKHSLTFTAGVLISFWILAAILIALKAGGSQVGWGFQLQNPAFIFVLTAILLVMGLSLSGVFEFGGSAIGVGSKLMSAGGLTGSFFSGVLSTVVATPCAGPILGVVLGTALGANISAFQSILIFTAMALGLALPYLILSIEPSLVKKLPRPGPWMEKFKQAMAFLIYATVAYLIWTIEPQLDDGGYNMAFLWALFGLVLIAVATWVIGNFATGAASRQGRRIAFAAAGGLALAGIALGFPGGILPGSGDTDSGPKIVWEDWTPETQERHLAAGNPVYIDFTARWCTTCIVNKQVALSGSNVAEAFADKNIVALRADWTNKNDTIREELAKYDRAAVPLNVLLIPGNPEPEILPEILTPGIVLERVERVPDYVAGK